MSWIGSTEAEKSISCTNFRDYLDVIYFCSPSHPSHNIHYHRVMSSPAVVGSTVPVAVLAVPVRVLAMPRVRGPWRLWAPDTVLVISLNMGESLWIGEEGEENGYIALALRWPAITVCWAVMLYDAKCSQRSWALIFSLISLHGLKGSSNLTSYTIMTTPCWIGDILTSEGKEKIVCLFLENTFLQTVFCSSSYKC